MALLTRGSAALRGALRGCAASQRLASNDASVIIKKAEESKPDTITRGDGAAFAGDLR